MGVLSWGDGFPKNIQRPLAAKLCVWSQKFSRYKNCSRSSITMPSLVGLGFHPPPGRQKMFRFFCLSICLSRFWTTEFVRPLSPWRRWSWSTETIWNWKPLDRGRFVHVVVQLCSTFSDCRQLATPQNAEFNKMVKFWGFSPPEGGDKINRSRRNLACKRQP